jgi:hypothetical protein
MDARTLEIVMGRAASMSRRGLPRLLGGAALTGAIVVPTAAASKADKKGQKRCKRQRGECIAYVETYCESIRAATTSRGARRGWGSNASSASSLAPEADEAAIDMLHTIGLRRRQRQSAGHGLRRCRGDGWLDPVRHGAPWTHSLLSNSSDKSRSLRGRGQQGEPRERPQL